MDKKTPDDYRGMLALLLGVTLITTVLGIVTVSVVDSFTGNNMRAEDLQMTVTLVIALLGTIGTYLGVTTAVDMRRKRQDQDPSNSSEEGGSNG